jgi:hypothetical protein
MPRQIGSLQTGEDNSATKSGTTTHGIHLTGWPTLSSVMSRSVAIEHDQINVISFALNEQHPK